MRCAVDCFGQFLLAFFYFAVQVDEHVVFEGCPLDGDRAKGCFVYGRFHRIAP